MTVPRAPGLPTSRPPPWKHRRPEEPRAGLRARPGPKPRQAPATPHQFCLCARARVETETALALPGESLRNPDLPSYIPLQHGRTPTDLRTRSDSPSVTSAFIGTGIVGQPSRQRQGLAGARNRRWSGAREAGEGQTIGMVGRVASSLSGVMGRSRTRRPVA
jgi:hypothetical protein